MTCRCPGDLQVDKNGCYICEEHHKVRGRFGLAWVSETPACPCPEPVGWQVEFLDTPSKVEQKCQEMVRWINCPPLPRCEPCPPDELCCKGKSRCNPCAPICNPCVPKCMASRQNCPPRGECGRCCRLRSPQRGCCGPMCPHVPRRCMPCPGFEGNDKKCSCADEKPTKGQNAAQGKCSAGGSSRMSAQLSKERGLRQDRPPASDKGCRTSSTDNWEEHSKGGKKDKFKRGRSTSKEKFRSGRSASKDKVRGRSTSRDRKGKISERLSRSLKRGKKQDGGKSIHDIQCEDGDDRPKSAKGSETDARKATILQYAATSADSQMARRFEEDFLNDSVTNNLFRQSKPKSVTLDDCVTPPKTCGLAGSNQQQYQMTGYSPEQTETMATESNANPAQFDTNYWAYHHNSPNQSIQPQMAPNCPLPPIPPHQMCDQMGEMPMNDYMGQNQNFDEFPEPSDPPPQAQYGYHSPEQARVHEELEFDPSQMKMLANEQMQMKMLNEGPKEEKTHGRRWLPSWLAMFKFKGRPIKPVGPESIVNIQNYSSSLGIN